QYTTAVNIGIIQGSIPVMVLIGAFLAYRTRISGLQMIGIAVTLIGIVLLATRGHPEQLLGLAFNFGDLLMLIA
uniref:EamA family transporter n=1 Tax=Acinetobacter baumannii TaxID=470 RepID=UPI0013D2D06F